MKLVKLDQPCDFRFRGRSVYINPEDVMRVCNGESCDEALVTLRSGETFTVQGEPGDIARLFEKASQ